MESYTSTSVHLFHFRHVITKKLYFAAHNQDCLHVWDLHFLYFVLVLHSLRVSPFTWALRDCWARFSARRDLSVESFMSFPEPIGQFLDNRHVTCRKEITNNRRQVAAPSYWWPCTCIFCSCPHGDHFFNSLCFPSEIKTFVIFHVITFFLPHAWAKARGHC